MPALAINWGTWDEMRTVSDKDRKQYSSLGLLPIATSEALAALGDLLQSEEPSIMAAAVNWRTLKAVFEARRKRPLLEAIEQRAASPTLQASARDGIRWEELPASERKSRLTRLIWEETRQVLQIEETAPVELDRGFFEMGMDSLVSVDLKSRLEARLGRSLPAMMTFNFPNVRVLANRLATQFAPRKLVPDAETETGPRPLNPDGLDDREVARLLAERLNRIRNRGGIPSSR